VCTSRYLFVMLIVLFMLTGCGNEEISSPRTDLREDRRIPEEAQDDVSVLVSGHTAFALDLYDVLRKDHGNLFFSPYCLSSCMGMVWAGARGDTESEIAQVFRFQLPQEQLHATASILQRSLNTGIEEALYQFLAANRIWGAVGYPWQESFLTTTQEEYGADLVQLDFAADPAAARTTINDWIANQTAQRITDLLLPTMVTPATRLVLTAAVYFKGNWASRFDPEDTCPGSFDIGHNRCAEVTMMHQTDGFGYAEFSDLSILEMPYVGQDLSMVILLPERSDGLSALEAEFDAENLASWLSALEEEEVEVAIPRFAFSSGLTLETTLCQLGMPSIFDGSLADLSGMTEAEGLCLSVLVHQAFVSVDEEGSDAAAGTGGVIPPPGEPPSFEADHPFLFLIRDRVTEAVLFLGRVVDPR